MSTIQERALAIWARRLEKAQRTWVEEVRKAGQRIDRTAAERKKP